MTAALNEAACRPSAQLVVLWNNMTEILVFASKHFSFLPPLNVYNSILVYWNIKYEKKLCRFIQQIYKVALMLFIIRTHVLSVSAISTMASTTNMFDLFDLYINNQI